MISVFNTYIHKSSFRKIRDVLDSTFLSEGKVVKEFEDALTRELSLPYPVTVNSGTSALHLALLVAGVGKGDEVICPAQTFVATALAVLYTGAKPVFADIQYETGNIDPKSIEKKITKKTKAIIPVHWVGYPCDMDEILKIAKANKLVVIEDAAHALGANYKGKTIGSISPITCFSFQAIKNLTTGDGGAVSFLKKKDYEKALKLRWFGIDRKNSKPSILGERIYDIAEVGYKFHLNNFAAALGIANLTDFNQRLDRRRKRADYYKKSLTNVPGIKLFNYKDDRLSAYWLFGLHVEKRNAFIKAMADRGIMVSVVHQRIDKNSIFGKMKNDLVNQAKFNETQIHIPIHDGLTESDTRYIVSAIKKGW